LVRNRRRRRESDELPPSGESLSVEDADDDAAEEPSVGSEVPTAVVPIESSSASSASVTSFFEFCSTSAASVTAFFEFCSSSAASVTKHGVVVRLGSFDLRFRQDHRRRDILHGFGGWCRINRIN
jgi:hypothetical protein